MQAQPPWWLLNGVKPAGPDRDMGGWTAIAFSPEQQARFGVDVGGVVLDQAKFDGAIQAVKAGTSDDSGRVRIVLKGGDKGLAADAGEQFKIVSPAPHQWKIQRGPDNWLRITAADGQCADLTNPGQHGTLAPESDVSGQHWKFEEVIGCKTHPDGSVGKGIVAYRLHTMWTGPGVALTALDDGTAKMQAEGAQEWEIQHEGGQLWMPRDLGPAPGAVERPEPEIAVCTFAEPEIAVCDFGAALGREPEIAVCDFGGPPAELEMAVEEQMLCGGLEAPSAGGPTELLEQIRHLAVKEAQKQGWNGVAFKQFEPLAHRTQVVAGTNHVCKVRLDGQLCAHLTIFEPFNGPPQLTEFSMPKTESDPL
mmetsp:Transcript_167924/g.539373  ORF Transcript_167924/g.539373 Transcript_167924/m.539373 type:complete len:365 (+) Transcript_167924:119-1213(+)